MSHARQMDRIYRFQRHFYDLTRPLFLPGRDALLDALTLRPGERVLEMGCGTARNLIRLAQRHPDILLFGVDASPAMLETATRSVHRAGLAHRIALRVQNAEDVDPLKTFGLREAFDAAFFSYSLTMMPTWREALDAACAALGGSDRLFVVDFGDQGAWPGPARFVLNKWLSLFHVQYPPDLRGEIQRRFHNIDIQTILGGYAFLAIPHRRPH